MSAKAPDIFDRQLRAKRLLKARGHYAEVDFLLRRMAQDINERLLDINRGFKRALVITPHECVLEELPALTDKVQATTLRRSAPVGDDFIDEEHLGLERGGYDLILSLGGLHSVNDLPGSLIQLRLSLEPDGLLLAAFPGGETLTELRACFLQAEAETQNGVSPRIHPFADMQDMGALLQRAGFALPVVDCDKVTVRYETPLHLMRELRRMGEANCLQDRRRVPLRRQTLMRLAEIYATQYGGSDGRVPASFDLIHISGWAPHESQQKPLRPGSAKMRLADALNTDEKKL
ncbi:MAG: SAM-dependent methyltransferase [Parvibaculales bacterium]